MKYRSIKAKKIKGHLDIFVSHKEDTNNGEIIKWDEMLIYENPEGLNSFAKLLIEIAESFILLIITILL